MYLSALGAAYGCPRSRFTGQYPEAIEAFNREIQLNPRNVEAVKNPAFCIKKAEAPAKK